MILIFSFCTISCEDFVDIGAPDDKMIREEVFNNDQTASSAMTGIYNQLMESAFSNGGRSSTTLLSGISSDVLKNIYSSNLQRMEFEQHEILPDNQNNFELWSSAYNMIYMANSFLEGLENSDDLDLELKSRLEGEARFVRAFSYFQLTNLYGDVPLLLTTAYRENELAAQASKSAIYTQILDDLNIAVNLLGSDYTTGERTQVNSGAALALLARVYLYMENWEMAENYSAQVIDQTSKYEILDDLNLVFKANSKEAVWQISPIGSGGPSTHTNEGATFIIDPIFYFIAGVKLDEEFITDFDEEDRRLSDWIGFSSPLNAYFPYKYKVWNSSKSPIQEYSMVLRFAEQYLIRAEARAQQGNISGAIADLDVIRERAGIALISESNPGITREDLLTEIYQERKKELFAEWGHRWFDLKRTGRAGAILGSANPLWNETDVLYPIPESELMKNANLTQNPGY